MITRLIKKDLVQHGALFTALGLGFVAVMLLSAGMNANGPFSISTIEIVRFSLISVIPLLAFIAGSRLIVDEYLGRTRLFVEALPVSRSVLVVEKYLFGWTFLVLLAVTGLVLAVLLGGPGDQFDRQSLTVIGVKTLVMVTLIWSVIFCFSLTGFLRLFLYMAFFLIVGLLIWYPGIEQEKLGPFSLMSANVFSYERESIPWRDVFETVCLAFFFAICGFLLALSNEGSVAEKLSKPLGRREFVFLGVATASVLVLVGYLAEQKQTIEPYEFMGDTVLLNDEPVVSILYLESQYLAAANQLLERTAKSIASVQNRLGIPDLPDVRIALEPGLELVDMDLQDRNGVFVRVDFSAMGPLAEGSLQTVILHEIFQALTNQRMSHENYHWILDGFSRWWAERGNSDLQAKQQQVVYVIHAFRQFDHDFRFFADWQEMADKVGYPLAELMAYSAFLYLEEAFGEEVAIALAREFLIQPVSESSIATLNEFTRPVATRFETIVGVSMDEFFERWEVWLEYTARSEPFTSSLDRLPDLRASVEIIYPDGAPGFSVTLESSDDRASLSDARCWIAIQRIDFYDTEMAPRSSDRHELSCQAVGPQVVDGPYSRGDRVFVAGEFSLDAEHPPIRFLTDRVTLQ